MSTDRYSLGAFVNLDRVEQEIRDRATIHGSNLEHLHECSGGPDCTASERIHGCFADLGECDDPEAHRV